MKRNKNLERAVILGLLLSTGVYGTVFAEQVKDGPESNVNWTDENGDGDIKSVVEDGDRGSGNIFVSGNVDISGKLTLINTQKDETVGKGINAYGGQVNISAKEIEIKTFDDGIFTTGEQGDGAKEENNRHVTVKDFDSLYIKSENGSGIQHNGNINTNPDLGTLDKGNIYIYGNEDSSITIVGGYQTVGGKLGGLIKGQKAAVQNKTSETIVDISGGTINLKGIEYGIWTSGGTVKVNGDNNAISATIDENRNDDYRSNVYNYGVGIYNSSSNAVTTIEATGNNNIHGDSKAVYATYGNVNITGKNNYFDVYYDEKIVREDLKESAQNVDRYAVHTTSGNVEAHATDGGGAAGTSGGGGSPDMLVNGVKADTQKVLHYLLKKLMANMVEAAALI